MNPNCLENTQLMKTQSAMSPYKLRNMIMTAICLIVGSMIKSKCQCGSPLLDARTWAKSTLINSLLKDRLLTGPEAGITRDAIEIDFEFKGRSYKLVDTAGIRRRARVADKVEKLMVNDALRAIKFAHLCVLLVDATEPLHKQDLAIARLVEDEGRAIVIGANKWDMVRNRQASSIQISKRLQTSLTQLRGVPVVHISGLHKKGLSKLLERLEICTGSGTFESQRGSLIVGLETLLEAHPPPLVDGRRLRIRYITQIKTRPPTFALFVGHPADLPESYLRYLTSGLRRISV